MLRPDDAIFSLATNQFDSMLAFYRSLLGEPKPLIPGKHATFPLPGSRLILWFSEATVSAGSALELCFQISNLEAAIVEAQHLTKTEAINVASHGRESFFHDPDGNRLILYQPNTA